MPRRSRRASWTRRGASSASCCPRRCPQIDGCELAASWQPAAGVGGDCFDAIAFGPSRLGLSIADVVGKGIPAALLMSNLQAAVRAFATEATQPASSVSRSTGSCAATSRKDGSSASSTAPSTPISASLTYANAGHYPPILVRADGSSNACRTAARCWASSPTPSYDRAPVSVGSGDRLCSSPTASPRCDRRDGEPDGDPARRLRRRAADRAGGRAPRAAARRRSRRG